MRTVLGVSWLVALAALAVGGELATTPVNQTVVVNGTKVTLKRKAASQPLFDVTDVTVYEAAAAGTDEWCVVVTGYFISHLPTHVYDIELTLDMHRVGYRPKEAGPCSPVGSLSTSIRCPPPGRKVRFAVVGQAGCAMGLAAAIPHSFRVTYKPCSALDGDKSGK